MRNETIAIHAGYDPDPRPNRSRFRSIRPSPTPSTAPITAPPCSISKRKAIRYSRIANPTTAVLEKRVAELEGGVGALAVATGQAALHFALVNLADTGGNIVSVPQLYGTTHTLLSHVLPRQGITTRFADSDRRTPSRS